MNSFAQVSSSDNVGTVSNAALGSEILFAKIDHTKGSGVAGHYLGRDGVQRFVKVCSGPAQAYGEHLANRIYRDLGFAAPESRVFEHEGRVVYASVVVEGAERLGAAGVTTERAEAFLEGFVADVLLANWNVLGSRKTRVLVLPDGRLMRAGNGGALLMRACAGRKAWSALATLTEWDKFRQHSVNPPYAAVATEAGMATDATLAAVAERGVKAVLELREKAGSWSAYVEREVPEMPEFVKVDIVEMLETRTNLLKEKVASEKYLVAN